MSRELYQPSLMRIAAIRDEAPGVRTLRLTFDAEADRAAFFARYRVGMFGQFGLPGEGESPFCIASPPTRTDAIECTFRRAGRVTGALCDREAGQAVTLRGPYGHGFPLEAWRGRGLWLIAGGMGLVPLRSLIANVLDRRDEFGPVTILYGSRTPDQRIYIDELTDWDDRADVTLIETIDPGQPAPGWGGRVGLVPTLLAELPAPPAGTVAVVCGPPVMIKFTLPVLARLGLSPGDVHTTLENRMKCGLGLCGRCNIGPAYVCTDGPVFTAEQLAALPEDL